MEYDFKGFENAVTAQALKEGKTCHVTGIGNSMTPILKSKQPVICTPVTKETKLKKRDIVLCKVRKHFYLHLIHAIRPGDMYLIGNNHGHMNGWAKRSNIFGLVTKIL